MPPPTNRKQFKPPRPGGRPTNASKASGSKSSKSKPIAKSPPRRKSAPSARTHVISSDDDEEDDDDDDEDSASSPVVNPSRQRRQSAQDVEDDDDDDDSMGSAKASPSPLNHDLPPTIPPPLLTKLLHHHFPSNQTRSGTGPKDDGGSNVRISKDAMGVVGKYMETFVREAIARAAYERNEELDRREKAGKGREVGGDVLEVSNEHVCESNVGSTKRVDDSDEIAPG